MRQQLFIPLYLILSLSSAVCSQSSPVSIRLELAYDTVEVGETFTVKYTLQNTQLSDFQTSDFKDFVLVAGPSTSLMSSNVNGQKSQTLSYTYYLSANYPGTFRIPPATVKTETGTLESSSLDLVVVETLSSPRQSTQDNAFQNPFDNNTFFNDPFFDSPSVPGTSMDEIMKEFDQIFEASPFEFDQSNPSKDNFSLDDFFLDNNSAQSIEELMKEFEKLYQIQPDSLNPKHDLKKSKIKKKEKLYKI